MKMSAARLLAGLLLLAVAVPAEAQTYRFDIGPHAGYSIWTPMLSGDETGGSSVSFENGWIVGGAATFYMSPRIGIRANGAYSRRGLTSDALQTVGAAGSLDATNIFALTGDLIFRLRQPSMEFQSGEWLPYVAVGAGARWIRPVGSFNYRTFDFENNESWPGVPFTVSDGNNRRFVLGRLSNPVGLVALGSDIRMAPAFAVRLEVGDRLTMPRIYEIQAGGGPAYTAINGRENQAQLAHDIYGQIGLQLTLGGAGRVAPVVVTPPPPPPPTPPTPPAPPPAPREEQLSICVIDPAAPGGARTVQAIRVEGQADTLVVQGGQRVNLRTTLPTVPMVGAADWYIAGRPLQLTVQRQELRFLATGMAAPRQANQLQLVGTLQGMPVYADRAALGAAADRFGQLNATAPADLAAAAQQHADVRAALLNLRTLYAPAQVVGCVFQPLQLQEEVRKSGE